MSDSEWVAIAALVDDALAGSIRCWSADEFKEVAARPGSQLIVADVKDARMAGVSLIRTVQDETELLTLAVKPDFRRRGIARALLKAAMEDAWAAGGASMYLEVSDENTAALDLYRTTGFVPVGRRTRYYRSVSGDGSLVDAIVMQTGLGAS